MNIRRTTLIVAVVLAVGTGWMTLTYLSGLQRQSAAQGASREVVVAAQEIPARVTITAEMLSRVSRPASAIDPNSVTDPVQAVGALSLITIPAGSTLTHAMMGHPSDVGLPVRLNPGMRAVSVQIDKVKGVSGLIQPGDRVDVIADPPRGNAAPPPASAILRGVRVLAIGASLEYSSATPSPQEANSTTVTLEVTPKQADLLVMADLNAVLRLALRSPKEALNSEPAEALHFTNGDAPSGPPVRGPGDSAAQAMALALRGLSAQNRTDPPRVSPAAPSDSLVKVIDGDRYTGNSSIP